MLLTGIFLNKHKKALCISLFVLLLFFITFRNVDAGSTDTGAVYIPLFNKLKQLEFPYILRNITDFGDSVVFTIFTKLTSYIGNYRFYLFTISLLFIGSISYFIYRYSEHPLLSFVVFFSLYYVLGFYLLRQIISLSILLFSYRYLKDRKIFKFSIIVILASLFHSSALIFLLAYPVYNIKLNYKRIIYILPIIVIIFVLAPHILDGLVKIFPHNEYLSNLNAYQVSDGWLAPLAFFSILSVVSAYFSLKFDKSDISKLTMLLILGTVFIALTNSIGEFYRISIYFTIFSIIIIPNLIEGIFKMETRNLASAIITIVFVAYFFFIVVSQNDAINYYLQFN